MLCYYFFNPEGDIVQLKSADNGATGARFYLFGRNWGCSFVLLFSKLENYLFVLRFYSFVDMFLVFSVGIQVDSEDAA